MKTRFYSKIMIALAVAVATAAAIESEASEQPMPPPANTALPASIPLGSSAGQVYKLAQAGVHESVILNYITNCPTAFNLDADAIIALTDVGLPKDVISAMFAHDKNLPPANNPSPAPMPAPGTVASSAAPPVTANNSAPESTGPAQTVTVNYFNDSLSPYGSWVEVAGYGRCWRPTVVVYDLSWRPYCDRGRWVYTDCGWYWDSEYSWGVTFHYGRWFFDVRNGWCWWPDTVWAPSWVTWRSCNDYYGWAPLPPFTVYNPDIGFCYRGKNIAVDFDFGLAVNCFTFVAIGNFCEPHPRHYCLPPQQVTQIYNQTTIINNYGHNNRTIVNNGVSVTTIGQATRHPIQAIPIGTLVNPGRRVWKDNNSGPHHLGADANGNPGTRNHSATAENNSGWHNQPGSNGRVISSVPTVENNPVHASRLMTSSELPTAASAPQNYNSGTPKRTSELNRISSLPAGNEPGNYRVSTDNQRQVFFSPRYSENNAVHNTQPVPPAKQNYYTPAQNYNAGSGNSGGNKQNSPKQYQYRF
jgi:hypothetical protein